MSETHQAQVARAVAAANARDRATLEAAAADYLADRLPSRDDVFRGSSHPGRWIGAALLSGRPEAIARLIRGRAFRSNRGAPDTALGNLAEEAWLGSELGLLKMLRILERDYRPLPGIPGRRDLVFLAPSQRKAIRDGAALLAAFAARDGGRAGKAINALGREDDAKFSLLAYALYREAQRLGLSLAIPRKYDF